MSEILRRQIAPLSFNARPTNRIQRVFHIKCLGIVLSFQKIGTVIVTGKVSKENSVDILYYMHNRGLVLMMSYLLQVFLPSCTTVNFTLDREWDWKPEADPGEDTVSYCDLQRSLPAAAEIYFSPV